MIGPGASLALVKSKNSGSWLFPKGRIEEGEDDEAAARREIMEEAGLTDLELIADLGEYVRPGKIVGPTTFPEKLIHMFLFQAPFGASLAASNEIVEARWVPFRGVPEMLGTPHVEWFVRDRLWFAQVFERVAGAIQKD